VMVSDDALPLGLIGISKADAARASAMLRQGGMVAFTTSKEQGYVAMVVSHTYNPETGADTDATRTKAPATFVTVPPTWSGPAGVIAPTVAASLGVQPATVALTVTGADITQDQQDAVDEGLSAISQFASMYVERGFQPDDATVIARIVLLVLGGVLMLGGTLTATFLALSDARPDLATLSAVGASPRTRRGVASAYAVVVGVVGAVLGAAVGFIPGIAVTWPLTAESGSGCIVVDSGGGCQATGLPVGPFLDVPWLMVLSLVVVLPAVTAVVVGLCARSRLPLVARLD
jgi:putative ABC transport system permease protein